MTTIKGTILFFGAIVFINCILLKIDTINTDDVYCMSYLTKENFGGDTRLRRKVKEDLGYEIIETKGVYTKTGQQKITGISDILNLDEDDIFEIIKDFLTKK